MGESVVCVALGLLQLPLLDRDAGAYRLRPRLEPSDRRRDAIVCRAPGVGEITAREVGLGDVGAVYRRGPVQAVELRPAGFGRVRSSGNITGGQVRRPSMKCESHPDRHRRDRLRTRCRPPRRPGPRQAHREMPAHADKIIKAPSPATRCRGWLRIPQSPRGTARSFPEDRPLVTERPRASIGIAAIRSGRRWRRRDRVLLLLPLAAPWARLRRKPPEPAG